MPIFTTAINWVRGHRTWILRGLAFAGFVVLALFLVVVVYRGHRTENNLIADWNDTIRVLGIEPVFPPEEDLYVGDLLAVVVRDTHKEQFETDRRPLLNRAVKLDHLNVQQKLHDYYDQLPMFPDTEDRPNEMTKFWPQKPGESWTFNPPTIRKVLPIAAFPGFVVESQSNASGSFGSLFGNLSAALQRSDDTQLQIPFVESYGIPSLVASKMLDEYCAKPATSSACTDATIREHLGYVSNKSRDYMTDTETDANGDVHLMVQVELALVNRVYLTRSIEQKIGHGAKRSTKNNVKNQEAAAMGGSGASHATAAAEGNSDGTASSGVRSPASIDLSADQNWDDTSNLDEVFERPIAFGYRAVKRRFDTVLRPKLLPGQLPEAPTAQGTGPTSQ
jgi:hypothetical protein